MTFGYKPCGQAQILLKGEGGGFPQVWAMVSLVSSCSFVHQKCSNNALINLLFGLCKFVRTIDPLITHPNPHLGALACPFTPQCCEPRSIPQLFVLSLISPLDSQFGGALVMSRLFISQYKPKILKSYIKIFLKIDLCSTIFTMYTNAPMAYLLENVLPYRDFQSIVLVKWQ